MTNVPLLLRVANSCPQECRPLDADPGAHLGDSLHSITEGSSDRQGHTQGGLHGVRRVLEKQGARTVLEPAGIMLDEIVKAHRWGMARVQPTSEDRIDSSFRSAAAGCA